MKVRLEHPDSAYPKLTLLRLEPEVAEDVFLLAKLAARGACKVASEVEDTPEAAYVYVGEQPSHWRAR